MARRPNLKKLIAEFVREEVGLGFHFSVERQEIAGRGDYSTNIAFLLSKKEKKAPLEVAEELAARMYEKHHDVLYAVEVAPPGFLNFFLSLPFLETAIKELLKPQKKKKLGYASVEFISANPTGPLHIGNARGGPIGDAISNILESRGWQVTREYFQNDAGAQIQKFSGSLWYWYQKTLDAKGKFELPEGGYEGEYVKEAARSAVKKWRSALLEDKRGKDRLVQFALGLFTKENFAVLKKLGITFDLVTKESTVLKTKTKKVLQELEKKGLLKKKDGALWFSPKDQHLKDRETVVVKSDGTPVYFANDIAYHKEKFSKNKLMVDILGEGHEGHIPKLYAIASVFGFPKENFKVVVHGQVNLVREGKIITMSKRAGNFITAEEVLREVGVDAFRFFMLEYAPRSGMQFDITLAKERSKKNPVYYVEYAHARASGILRKAKVKPNFKKTDWRGLDTLAELSLIKQILALEEVLDETASDFEVQRLTRYAYELARSFTNFYETTPVLNASKDILEGRLALVLLTKNTLAGVLKLMGIRAPDKM